MKKNKFKVLLERIVINAKVKIKELANTELNNKERKQKLDEYIIKIIEKTMDELGSNFIARWTVEHYLIPMVDDITQYIYDLLKARVAKVTVNEKRK